MTTDERIERLVSASEHAARETMGLVRDADPSIAQTIFLDPVRLERWRLHFTMACTGVALSRTGSALGKERVPEVWSAVERVVSAWDSGGLAALLDFIKSDKSMLPVSDDLTTTMREHATGFWLFARTTGHAVERAEMEVSASVGSCIHANFERWWERESEWSYVNSLRGNPLGVSDDMTASHAARRGCLSVLLITGTIVGLAAGSIGHAVHSLGD